MESATKIEGDSRPGTSASHPVSEALARINRAWLDGRPNDLSSLLHPDMIMVYPGFSGRSLGRAAVVAGFVDFCGNARVHSYHEGEAEVDVVENTAVVTNTFEMVYEREAKSYQANGRDLWIFSKHKDDWVATWRTMLDLVEKAV